MLAQRQQFKPASKAHEPQRSQVERPSITWAGKASKQHSSAGTTVSTISFTHGTGLVGKKYFAIGCIYDSRNLKWVDAMPLLKSMNSCKAEPGISSRTELLVWLVAEEFSRCRESIIQLFPEESRNEIKLFLERRRPIGLGLSAGHDFARATRWIKRDATENDNPNDQLIPLHWHPSQQVKSWMGPELPDRLQPDHG